MCACELAMMDDHDEYESEQDHEECKSEQDHDQYESEQDHEEQDESGDEEQAGGDEGEEDNEDALMREQYITEKQKKSLQKLQSTMQSIIDKVLLFSLLLSCFALLLWSSSLNSPPFSLLHLALRLSTPTQRNTVQPAVRRHRRGGSGEWRDC